MRLFYWAHDFASPKCRKGKENIFKKDITQKYNISYLDFNLFGYLKESVCVWHSKIIIFIVFITVGILSYGHTHAEFYKWIDYNGTENYINARRYNTNKTKIKPHPLKTKVNVDLNPIAAIPRLKAIKDLNASLARRYKTSCSGQKKVFDIGMNIGMNNYEKLCLIPFNDINNQILMSLKSRYYPHFSLIWSLYKSLYKNKIEKIKRFR